MGLSDDPLQPPMQAPDKAAVSWKDLQREQQRYHLRALNGYAIFVSVPLGALIGMLVGIKFFPDLELFLVLTGAIGAPAFLSWMRYRKSRSHTHLSLEEHQLRDAEREANVEQQIAEAKARGDFDKWKKDE
ncbi:MAG: hypothetical protein ABJ139_04035 [Paracoccaceae bacterium]